jgi:purine nucleoside phosphorylase
MPGVRVGIITGSGTYALPGLEVAAARERQTPFGPVVVSEGRFAGVEVVHVSRHEPGHRRLSNHVNHRANVLALRDAGAEAVLGVTVCGAVDPNLALGSLVVFDDLHFLANRLPDGSLCTLCTEPGGPGRGHWVYEQPFSEPLRAALLHGSRAADLETTDGGCYGHVDGPRFNTAAEIRQLAHCGVTAVSQTAGAETVLCGEAELPYALLGYLTDYANGVSLEPTPVSELARFVAASADALALSLRGAVAQLAGAAPPPVGLHLRFD